VFRRIGLGPKIYLVVILLSLVAASISYVGVNAMQTYNRRVHQLQHYAHSAIVGEQVNELILAVVMDSRGIYMARDHAEAEKFAPLILKNLGVMKQQMAEWTDFAEPEDKDKMDRANARADEFIKFRTELVRLSREATLEEARAYGDNDANRTNRSALNREMETLAAIGQTNTTNLTKRTESYYESKLITMIVLGIIGIVLAVVAVVLVVYQFNNAKRWIVLKLGETPRHYETSAKPHLFAVHLAT